MSIRVQWFWLSFDVSRFGSIRGQESLRVGSYKFMVSIIHGFDLPLTVFFYKSELPA